MHRVFATLFITGTLVFGGVAQAAKDLPVKAPPAKFASGGGKQIPLARYKGQKVMLWMFSTWCPSCAAGFQALVEQQPVLAKAGLRVIALKNYRNGGYPGPSLQDFVKRFGSPLLKAPNWTFGEVTADMAAKYNPRRYPDIYFLIDEKGMLQAVDGAPGATMSTIKKFVGLS